MTRTLHDNDASMNAGFVSPFSSGIAQSMVGSEVSLLVAKKVRHGLVTGCFVDVGVPKLIVGGVGYNLRQVLSVIPHSP